jgi:diacylglycerol kinase family enzyme
VQVGPTYGGGFAIAPGANPSDGVLDLCYSIGHPTTPHLLALLGAARFGLHTGSAHALLRYARELSLDFSEELPVQVDGEPLHGTHFDIHVEPRALVVLTGRSVRW